MKKKIIILESARGARLANQLWNFISVYAYCLERQYNCLNLSFFEVKKHKHKNNVYSYCNYYNFFNIPLSLFIRLLISIHLIIAKICKRIRFYERFISLIRKLYPEKILYSGDQDPFYLPPSAIDPRQLKQLANKEKFSKIYLSGWLFRNPAGLLKYHKEIIEYFRPKLRIQKKVNSFITELKSKYIHIVGVHIRQGDYKNEFRHGELYFDEKAVSAILREYLDNFRKNKNQTCFIICSDENVKLDYFTDLNVIKSNFNTIEDLFLLAATDIIIGANSTFGALAAYYGNIPFIVFQRERIDWEYYKNKNEYFENKYSTFVWY